MQRWEADVTATQSRSVLIFTIVTIVFLPLSYFSSLFGMNVREWSGTETNATAHTVVLYSATISMGIILTALFLAFNQTIRDAGIMAVKYAQMGFKNAVFFLSRIIGLTRLIQKFRRKKQHIIAGYPSGAQPIDDDFWAKFADKQAERLPLFNGDEQSWETASRSSSFASWNLPWQRRASKA
jgi:hypothetical protein